jgi:hypothetical protein
MDTLNSNLLVYLPIDITNLVTSYLNLTTQFKTTKLLSKLNFPLIFTTDENNIYVLNKLNHVIDIFNNKTGTYKYSITSLDKKIQIYGIKITKNDIYLDCRNVGSERNIGYIKIIDKYYGLLIKEIRHDVSCDGSFMFGVSNDKICYKDYCCGVVTIFSNDVRLQKIYRKNIRQILMLEDTICALTYDAILKYEYDKDCEYGIFFPKIIKCIFVYNGQIYKIQHNRVYNFDLDDMFVCKLPKKFNFNDDNFETREGTIYSHVSDCMYRYDFLTFVI